MSSDKQTSATSNRVQPSTLNLVGILGVSLLVTTFVATNPAMNALGEHYAGQNYTLLSTIHTILSCPVTIITGLIVSGGKLKYRTCAILGTLVMFICGVLPGIIPDPSFEVALVCRALFGVGVGLISPLPNSLIINIYEGQKQATYTGYIQMLKQIGAVIVQMIGGFLAAIPDTGWHLHYFAYAFLIVGVIAAFFVPEPPEEALIKAQMRKKAQNAKGSKLGATCFVVGIILFLFNICYMPLQIIVSTQFALKFGASAALAGTGLSVKTGAGIAGALLYGLIYKYAKRFTASVGFGSVAIGAGLMFVAPNVMVSIVGLAFAGFGFAIVMPTAMQANGQRTSPAKVALATSIVLGLVNISSFFSSLYIQGVANLFCGGVIKSVECCDTLFMLSCIGMIILTVVFLIVNPYPKQTAKEREEALAAEADAE